MSLLRTSALVGLFAGLIAFPRDSVFADEIVLPQVVPPAYAPPPSGPITVAQEETPAPDEGSRIFSSGPIEPADDDGVLLPPAEPPSPAEESPFEPSGGVSTPESPMSDAEESPFEPPDPSGGQLTPAPDVQLERAPPPPVPVEPEEHATDPVIVQDQTVYGGVVSEPDYVYTPAWETQVCYTNASTRWLSVESLIWWTNGSHLPAIATTSPNGTPAQLAGVLAPVGNAQVVYGGGDIFDFNQAGFRIRGGRWFDDRCDGTGVMAEFFMLAPRSETWYAASNGDPILTRPFFNADPTINRQDSQIIAFPGLSSGTQRLNGNTNMYSAALHLWGEFEMYIVEDECGESTRRPLIGQRGCDDECWQLGLKIGPRFSHLNDTINISESLTSARTGSQFQLQDYFDTQNSFFGGEIGLLARRQQGALNLDVGLQLAIGVTHQELEIRGSNTVTTAAGASTTEAGGFFAQPSNIGKYDESSFSLIPALDVSAGLQLSEEWKFTVGYSLMYWTNVLRASEQIDTTINEAFFNSPTPGAAVPNRPQTTFAESDFLAHGITIGFERRW